MFKCDDCDAVFEHATTVVEKHGLDTPPYEHWAACPECGSTDIEEIDDYEEDDNNE